MARLETHEESKCSKERFVSIIVPDKRRGGIRDGEH